MKTLAAATASAALLALGAPAFAGGLNEPVVEPVPVVPAPVPVAPVNVSDWTGFYVGGSLGYGRLSSDQVPDEEPDGMTYGAHAGYMYDFGRVVLGGELEYSGADISYEDGAQVDLDSVARAKLRVGYDAGNIQPYLVGGLARASVSGDLEGEGDGQFFGAGIDYRFRENVIVGAEVLQHQFDDIEDSGIDVDATTVALRASFQF